MTIISLTQLTRSAALALMLAGLVTFLPGLRKIQVVEAAGAPLPRLVEAAMLSTQAPGSVCLDRTRIVQDCSLARLPGIQALERQVIADLIALHQLPASAPQQATPPPGAVLLDAGGPPSNPLAASQDSVSRLLSWERATLRALLFDKITQIINKEPAARTDPEKAIVADLAAKVQRQRLTAATEAKRFYELWRSNPCAFKPPAGFTTYEPPQSCFVPNSTGAIFQNPPSLEQFQAYGAAIAYERFQTDADLQAAAANAAKGYLMIGGAAAAGVAAVAAYHIAGSTFGEALVNALLPFAARADAAAAVISGGGALAASALVIVIAVATLIVASITVFTAAEIPAKLDAAIAAAQTPPDLAAEIAKESGKQELFGVFVGTTVPGPDSPAIVGGFNGFAPVPAAQPDDQKFLIDPGGRFEQVNAELDFKTWERTGRARLSQGWFVDESAAGGPALTLHLDYINHAGEKWTVWRIGDRFLHTTADNAKPSFMSDVIQYEAASSARRTAQILPAAPTQTITVLPPTPLFPNRPPVFAAPAQDVRVDQTDTAGAVVSFPTPAATDSGGNAATVTCTPASGATFAVGVTPVNCAATDSAGTVALTDFVVIVRQTLCHGMQPTIVAQPGVPTTGTDGHDVILGTDGPDEIRGGGSDDVICGLGGDDRIYGEGGSDVLYGDDGNDLLDGGDDTDSIFGGSGDDTLLGGAGNDWLEDRQGMSQTFDGGGDLNRCFDVSTAAPGGTVANCQIRSP